MFERFAYAILKHRKLIVGVFLSATLVCAVLATGVKINPTLSDYLPNDADSTVALEVLSKEFDEPVPNVRVMINDLTLMEALEYKQSLSAIKNVSDVTWLDDVVDLNMPLEMADQALVAQYYHYDKTTGRGPAHFSLATITGDSAAINAIYELCDNSPAGGSITGDAIVSYTGKELVSSESTGAIIIVIPIILLILLLSTTSWLEPFLFLLSIGCAVVINMGTNIFIGEVSFITNAIAPILQLAVSLDYSIFLLHAFRDYRNETDEHGEPIPSTDAMVKAMRRSYPAILASAATTLFGFMALCFMNFGIGPNLGVNLVKGVALSFISISVFLPALTLITCKLVDRTRHRAILPSFKGAGKYVLKARIPALVCVLLLIVPCFLAKENSDFIYGLGSYEPGTRQAADAEAIDNEFGKSTPMVIAVPVGDVVAEKELSGALAELPQVSAVISYARTVGVDIPPEIVDRTTVSRFYSANLARIILYTNAEDEGDASFALVQTVRDLTSSYYDDYYVASQNAIIYDLKLVITEDNQFVTWLAIIAIGLVILLAFRSISLPVILVLTIETAIWINLSVPYFTGGAIQYIGFLVVSTVQLGATVDYAILYTGRYLAHRKTQTPHEATRVAHGETFQSIIVSALILSVAGAALWISSSSPIVTMLGLLICRGALLSFALTCFFLPGILVILDRFIGVTTLRSNFYKVAPRFSLRRNRKALL